ncbi:hypothetical protein N9B55_01365 [Vicingaceae bacterium]|nr:hypothetical protein [Vicingaceae bacterium]MDB4060509.1 hypothetical protein [Vicingaceae bacterium]
MNKLIAAITFIILIFCYEDSPAQPPGPGGGVDPRPGCDDPPCIPIDGGLSWLLIAGTAYGGKKLYKANKEKNAEA